MPSGWRLCRIQCGALATCPDWGARANDVYERLSACGLLRCQGQRCRQSFAAPCCDISHKAGQRDHYLRHSLRPQIFPRVWWRAPMLRQRRRALCRLHSSVSCRLIDRPRTRSNGCITGGADDQRPARCAGGDNRLAAAAVGCRTWWECANIDEGRLTACVALAYYYAACGAAAIGCATRSS
jgi:hypothetical protein